MSTSHPPQDASNEDAEKKHMSKRINNLFSGQDLPSYASVSEVEAMKRRIRELETALTEQQAVESTEAAFDRSANSGKAHEEKAAASSRKEKQGGFLNYLFRAPDFEDVAKNRVASLQQKILLGLLFASILSIPVLIWTGSEQLQLVSRAIVVEILLCGLAFFWMRQGQIERAGWLMVVSIYSIFVFGFSLTGYSFSSGILLAIVVTLAGVLLSFQSVIAVTLIVAFTPQMIDYLVPSLQFESQSVFVPIIIGLLGLLLTIASRALDDSFAEADRSKRGILQANRSLQDLTQNLEQRVADRTHDLELASEVGRAVSEGAGNLSGLLFKAVETIRSRFNLYYTQIYLVNPTDRSLVLRAGTGEAGAQLLRRGHRLIISSTSLNGRAALERQPILVDNTQTSPNFLPNPLLPHTRSELSIPLIANNTVVGVLDMQSDKGETFNESNLTAFQVLAGQLAIAIQNAALLEETEEARREVEERARRLTTSGWQDFLNAVDKDEQVGFAYDQENIIPLTQSFEAEPASGEALSVPISVLGTPVGAIQIAHEERMWTEREMEILQSASTQLAQHLENLRLLEQAERYRRQAEDAARLLTREGWEQYLQMRENLFGVVYDQNRVQPLNEHEPDQNHAAYKYPLKVRDAVIGELAASASGAMAENEAEELIQHVVENLSAHLENLRLLEQAEINRLEAQKSQEQYALAVDGANDGVWDWNIVTNEVYFSPRWKSMVGYNEDELNDGFADFERLLHPEDHDRVLAAVNDYLLGKLDTYDVEFRFHHKDDSYRWIRARGKALRGADGSPYRMAGSHTDITERKQFEEALRLNESRLSTALDIARLGNWEYDFEKDIFTFNDNFYAVFRTNVQEVGSYEMSSAEYAQRFVHPEDAALVGEEIGKAINTTERNFNQYLEHRAIFADGSIGYIAVNIHVERDENGKIIRWHGANQDITESKVAQNIIAARANQLETVATVSTTASTVLNPDELLKQVVNLTKERFGLYHAHIYLLDENWSTLLLAAGAGEVGRQMVDSGHTIELDAEQSLVARAARERQTLIVNDIREEKDFLPNPLLPETIAEMAIPMVVGDRVLGVFDIQSNIINGFTDEDAQIGTTLAAQVAVALQNARLYQEQAATVVQLRELDRLKSAFLANMSHELRTPLNSILGFTEVILEGLDGPLTINMGNDLQLIQKNGQHLLSLINDVLDMAKIESGTMNLIVENFNLQEIFEEVISITAPFANEKKIELLIEPESDHDLEVKADRTRLRQVLLNIVNNATKFTEQGSISIRATRDEDSVLIRVKDTGIGIPPAQLEAVFYEFTQVDSSTTRKAGGTGLGLPISRRLIEMHGGRLWAESTGVDGEGAVFHIHLPIEAKVTEPEPVNKN